MAEGLDVDDVDVDVVTVEKPFYCSRSVVISFHEIYEGMPRKCISILANKGRFCNTIAYLNHQVYS